MFTPTLRCECAQPGLIDTMRKWSIKDIRETKSSTKKKKKKDEGPQFTNTRAQMTLEISGLFQPLPLLKDNSL